MGWQPKNAGPAPTTESFHLSIARSAYIGGSMAVEDFERSVAHVLAGGCLNQHGRVPADDPRTPPAPFQTESVG